MEVVRDYSCKRGTGVERAFKDVRKQSLEELFTEFYSYQHDGDLPEESFENLISYVAEQTRNSEGDETEAERKSATRKLIEYAAKCEA